MGERTYYDTSCRAIAAYFSKLGRDGPCADARRATGKPQVDHSLKEMMSRDWLHKIARDRYRLDAGWMIDGTGNVYRGYGDYLPTTRELRRSYSPEFLREWDAKIRKIRKDRKAREKKRIEESK
jgi:hypothetical protein